MSDFFLPSNFAGLPPEYSDLTRAHVVILPVPYDATTSGLSGARDGPRAIIEASVNMEWYDIGIEAEPYRSGIHTLPAIEPDLASPERTVQRVRQVVADLLAQDKFVVTLGGEHTVSVGAVQAHAARYRNLSVLAFDAHADLREDYMGTAYSHACTLRRILDVCPRLVQVGLRSATREEHDFIREGNLPFYTVEAYRALTDGPAEVLSYLSSSVYVSIDLDAFDPSQVAAVGTPEPGGLLWHEVTGLLARVARERRIVGFDVTELAPALGPYSGAQLAAKLIYRLIGLTQARR